MELRQGLQRLRLVGIDLEDRLPGTHGALGFLERVLVEDRDPLGDHLAFVAVDGELQVAFEDLHQLARTSGAGQQALERQEISRSSGLAASAARQASIASAARPSGDSSSLAGRGPELRLQVGIDRFDRPSLQRHDQRGVQLGAEAERLHRRQGLHRLHVGQPGAAAAVKARSSRPRRW